MKKEDEYLRRANEAQKWADQAKSDKFVYQDAIDKYIWTEKEDIVTPTALSILSRRAADNNLKLISYRPLKSTETATGILLPMQFTLDGSFASVASMLESLEQPTR